MQPVAHLLISLLLTMCSLPSTSVYVDGTNLESDAILKNACGEINLSVGLDTPVAALQRWCMRRASSAILIVDAPQDAKPEEALASLVRGVPRACAAAWTTQFGTRPHTFASLCARMS